jgi:valyl-tRNA synthetase
VEDTWYRQWKEKGYFHADEEGSDNTFAIVIPPPNVTGSLHMGHALNNTLQDILIRYKRMVGLNTLWMPGTDHAGIATQNVVEKQLTKEKKTRNDLGRQRFVERVWEWKKEFGGIITSQLMRLGASCDWERERFTMDEGLSRAVREVFVRLYHEGLIYQGNYIINWCPRCQTALSDLEVEHEEVKGNLYHIEYPLVGKKKSLVVATTRPETMLGDTGVAVHPEDHRFSGVVGKKVILPLMNRQIPIIADSYVDVKFGTGALKVTPAHDPNDFEIGKVHRLAVIKVIDEEGMMSEEAGPYMGLDRFACREKVLKDLKANELLKKVEPYEHAVGHCYRCKTIVEPNLSPQWFVKTKPLAEPAIEAVLTGKTKIVPEQWEKTYFEWMNNIKDWCISRQIWWGHRIPAWKCQSCGNITVEREDPTRCSHCGSESIERETDVLDTWFSSKTLQTFYPTSVLVTGFDILFFWVARMMMMGLKFMGEVPFSEVYIHALVRDMEGQKMSKSKGNVIDPLVVMDQYGTDAFRFTLAALATQGRDIRLSEERIVGYRNFMNKLWNASRLALMNLEDFEPEGFTPDANTHNLATRWILSRLNRLVDDVRRALDEYKFNEAAHYLYQFTWHEFCDWYLEVIKPSLYQKDNPEERRTAQSVLTHALDTLLRLLHPFIPFLTEELWQKLPGRDAQSIMISSYPQSEKRWIDRSVEAQMNTIIEVISTIRNVRAEAHVPPASRVHVLLVAPAEADRTLLSRHEDYIKNLARVKELTIKSEGERVESAAVGIAANIEVVLFLEGVVDFKQEEARLQKELGKVLRDLKFVTRKLGNEEFLGKAPSEIINKEKVRAKELTEKRTKLEEGLSRIKGWQRPAP